MESFGWSQNAESLTWTFHGHVCIASLWGPEPDETPAHRPAWFVRVWPRLHSASIVGVGPFTAPLGASNGALRFGSEEDARAYITSWEMLTEIKR